jgi:DeoR/GlpR family transcriptional regulator of sugar metabolism
MSDRNIKILDLLAAHKNIKVTMLAEILDVSQVTIRKDLDNLEKRGIIHRAHGYACLDGTETAGKRMAYNHLIKRRIAKAAVEKINENETIMIESGSCCALFAEELACADKNAMIITNSAFIANYICKFPGIRIILLGGYYQPESQVMVGPLTTKCGEVIFADKFFLGTDGYIPGQGFTGRDHLRVKTITELSERAKDIFILTDADKFKHRGVYDMIRIEKLAGVFTDDAIPYEAETVLKKYNVPLYKVPGSTDN